MAVEVLPLRDSERHDGWSRRAAGVMAFIVIVGLALRAYHYGRNPPMWGDEGATAANILEQSYREIGGPLRMHQAMPPLFQAAERGAAQLLGENEWALRLLPFLASCVTLILVAFAGRQAVGGLGGIVAVAVIALSDRMLWHATEAKVYAVDAMAGAAAIAWFAGTRRWRPAARVLPAAAMAPVALWGSFPAVFILGALWLAFAVDFWNRRTRRDMGWLALLALAIGGAMVPLLLGPMRAQKDAAIMEWWAKYFFPAATPWRGPLWALGGTAALFDFLLRPAGTLLWLPATVGLVSFWKRDRPMAVLTTLPPLLALGAACVRQYPYGGARIMMFALPGLAILVAEGTRALLAAPPRWRKWTAPAAGIIVAAAVMAAVTLDIARVITPWPRADTRGGAAYILQHRAPADPVISNDWSYAFYLRSLGALYSETPPDTHPERLWAIDSGDDAGARRFLIDLLNQGWRPTGTTQDFPQTHIVTLHQAATTTAAAPDVP